MHYYKFNIADWSLGTAHLSLVEEAIYFRLINFYYDSESPIPLETQSVFRRLRMASESVAAQQIIEEFFTKTERGYIHERCDVLLKEYRKTAKNNRANGAKGGRPKKDAASEETKPKPSGLSPATESEPTHNPNQEPETINQEPLTTLKDIAPTATPEKKSRKTGSRLPGDWRPTQEYVDAAMQLNPDYTREWFSATAHKFRDYWVAKTGKDATKADWLATWRNWVRNDLEYNRGKNNAKPKQLDNESTDWLRHAVGTTASGGTGEQDLRWLESNFPCVGGSAEGSGLSGPSQGGMA
jgi:uncharacterized protein YdaU (DUF1376 family)